MRIARVFLLAALVVTLLSVIGCGTESGDLITFITGALSNGNVFHFQSVPGEPGSFTGTIAIPGCGDMQITGTLVNGKLSVAGVDCNGVSWTVDGTIDGKKFSGNWSNSKNQKGKAKGEVDIQIHGAG